MTPKTPAKTAAKAAPRDLSAVFDELHAILARFAKPFTVREKYVRDKRDYHLILKKKVITDGREKDELWFASIIQQKNNVGFYFSAAYCPPELLKHLDGKTCFHMTELTPQLKKDVTAALKNGIADYKKKGWL